MDLVTKAFQEAAAQTPNRRIVLDQENRFVAAARLGVFGWFGRRNWQRAIYSRQKNQEGRTRPDAAGHFNPPLVLFDDAIDSGQAEARPFTEFFGGEKWLKNSRQVLGPNTAT